MTVSVGLDITRLVRPPRTAFLNYPMGNETGRPGRADEQRVIVQKTLEAALSIKQAGEIGARLGAKYGYAFNCTSNFSQPNFGGMWEDIEYHKRVTGIIRAGAKKNLEAIS